MPITELSDLIVAEEMTVTMKATTTTRTMSSQVMKTESWSTSSIP